MIFIISLYGNSRYCSNYFRIKKKSRGERGDVVGLGVILAMSLTIDTVRADGRQKGTYNII